MLTTDTVKYSWLIPEMLINAGSYGETSDAYGLTLLMHEVLGRVENRPSLGPVHDCQGAPAAATLTPALAWPCCWRYCSRPWWRRIEGEGRH